MILEEPFAWEYEPPRLILQAILSSVLFSQSLVACSNPHWHLSSGIRKMLTPRRRQLEDLFGMELKGSATARTVNEESVPSPRSKPELQC